MGHVFILRHHRFSQTESRRQNAPEKAKTEQGGEGDQAEAAARNQDYFHQQKRVPREPPIDEYAWLNNDPIWLLQNEMYAELDAYYDAENAYLNPLGPEELPTSEPLGDHQSRAGEQDPDEDDLPF